MESVTTRPAFAKTHYSGVIAHDDGQSDDDAGCAAGKTEGEPVGTRRALRLCFGGYRPCWFASGCACPNAGPRIAGLRVVGAYASVPERLDDA